MMDVVVFSAPAGAQIRAGRSEAIQQRVPRAFGLQVEELNQRSTTRAVTLPRQLAIYLAKQLTDASLVEIGNHFGGKHHSTVMHSVAKIDQLGRKDPAVHLAVDILMKTLKRS